ncbi:MAG: leucyl aminopeptidase family protein [Alphaproteobacteria bacterium]|nr:leucyl aminopeptidase family protein [Alphaproteobacteria bacterium]
MRPKKPAKSRSLTVLTKSEFAAWLKKAPAPRRRFVEQSGFTAAPGEIALLPAADGAIAGVLAGIRGNGGPDDLWAAAGLAQKLPAGVYACDPEPPPALATLAAIGWGLGAYAFTRYRKAARRPAELVLPKNADRAKVARTIAGATLTRDLVNTPAEDMGPAELAAAASALAKRHGMAVRIVEGDDLLAQNYPLIHAVGRASARAPRLIDLTWGDPTHPRITIVGKGVCFDTGGLDLKNDAGMKLMKKDMGGAAHVLGLAEMIALAKLKIRLRVLVAAVDNAVSGNAFRPLDVIRSRKGLTVEIGNTDAEGRLILADALTDALAEKPALLIDFATLTGAARVALGPELPPMYANRDETAAALLRHAAAEADPLWHMPLWAGYRSHLDSKVADLNNVTGNAFAGSVTAALFLQEFAGRDTDWVHLDIYAWNPSGRPGRPEGAEAQCLRAVFALIAERAEAL